MSDRELNEKKAKPYRANIPWEYVGETSDYTPEEREKRVREMQRKYYETERE